MSIEASCQIVIPMVEGLEDSKLSVGRHFDLNCQLSDALDFNFEQAQFKSNDLISYKIFNYTKTDDKNFKLDLTWYKTGSLDFSKIVFSDGVNEINLKTEPLTIESVIVPPADGKPVKPFGSIFPIGIPMPSIYIWGLLGILVLIILKMFFSIKKQMYFKKLKLGLQKYQSPIDPETQFYKTVRSLEKKHYPVDELENCFKLYILRAYQVPVYDLTPEKTIKYFKFVLPQYKETRLQYQKLITDFEEFKKLNDSIDTVIKAEFLKKLYRFVDKNKGIDL